MVRSAAALRPSVASWEAWATEVVVAVTAAGTVAMVRCRRVPVACGEQRQDESLPYSAMVSSCPGRRYGRGIPQAGHSAETALVVAALEEVPAAPKEEGAE